MDFKVLLLLCTAVFLVLCSSLVTGLSSTPSSSPTSFSTTKKPEKSCKVLNSSCGTCTDDSACYWCASDSTCKKYPTSKIVPRDCKGNKWYFQQCFAPGYILIIVVPSVCGVLLLIFGCCIYCCCCRTKGSSGYDREQKRIRQRREEARQRSEARRNDRKKRSDAIRQKYGLLSNEDDNEVV